METATTAEQQHQVQQGSFLGHPRGLSTLFFTEFWERFSFYGLRAILLLFMVAPAAQNGMGFDTSTAGFIVGLYMSLAYLASVPGGWIADNLTGQQNAVLYGGIFISLGNLLLAFHGMTFVYGGLLCVIIGTGLLKPNVSAIVGSLYSPDEPARRDAGFSIFYMGINAGAFVAPLVVGTLGERVNWHIGFFASSIGMACGVVWYLLGRKTLGLSGQLSESKLEGLAVNRRRFIIAVATIIVVALTVYGIQAAGIVSYTFQGIRGAVSLGYLIIPVVFFTTIFSNKSLTSIEKRRFGVVAIFFLLSTVFWASFEQAATTFTLFARDITDRMIGTWEMPVSYFQSINSMFIILLAPAFAALWLKLGSRQPSAPAKFGIGLVFVGIGFFALVMAVTGLAPGMKVSPFWLVSVYLIHTIGELCISPVGLSNVTKLVPLRYTGQAMGIWFLGSSLGNYLAGQAASFTDHFPMAEIFFVVFCVASGVGIVVLFVAKPIRNLMGGIQ